MKFPQLLFIAIATALSPLPAFSQAASPNENGTLSTNSISGAWDFTWNAVSGRTYFLLHTEELANPTPWQYLPVIEQGNGNLIRYSFWLSPLPSKFFLCMRHTGQTAADPYAADFDSDGIPNGWEIEKGLDPFNAADASIYSGGFTNFQLYQQSLDFGGDPSTTKTLGFSLSTP